MIKRVKILDFTKKSFEKDGQVIEYANLLVRTDDDQVVKYKAQKDFDFKPFVDQLVDIEVVETPNMMYEPQSRAIRVVE